LPGKAGTPIVIICKDIAALVPRANHAIKSTLKFVLYSVNNRNLFQFVVKKDSEIAPRRRVLRRAQDVVSLSNHGGRGEVCMKDIILNKTLCELCGEYSFTVKPEEPKK
jgi:hypothetical protein